MMNKRWVLLGLTAVIALASGVLAGCGDDKKAVALTVKASEPSEGKYAFDLPATIDGGVVALTLDNVGTVPHEIAMVQVKEGTTPEQVTEDLLGNEGGPIPDYVLSVAGVGFAAPGKKATATQKIPAGSYVYFCTFGEGEGVHYKNGMLGSVTVKGDKGKGDLPEADGTIKATEYSFDVSGLKAGEHTYRFENTGKELHHAQLFPINDGATIDDVEAFFGTQGTLDLKAGDYVMLCFINDKAGGPPHFTKGMLQKVTVS